jgi:acetate kinase
MPSVLTIKGGSSSIRFAVYETGDTLRRRLDRKVDRIGLRNTNLSVYPPDGTPPRPRRLAVADHRSAVRALLDWLEAQPAFASVTAGHQRERDAHAGADL